MGLRLLWPVDHRESETVWLPRLGHKRWCSHHFACGTIMLGALCCHVRNPVLLRLPRLAPSQATWGRHMEKPPTDWLAVLLSRSSRQAPDNQWRGLQIISAPAIKSPSTLLSWDPRHCGAESGYLACRDPWDPWAWRSDYCKLLSVGVVH